MQVVSGPILGLLSDRWGRRPVLLICLLGTSLAFTLLGLAGSLPVVFLAVLLDGITGGNLTTAYAYIADVTEPEDRARGMGLVGAAYGLGMIGGPALGGLLSAYGLMLPAFCAAAVALANVIFGFFMLPESLPPERRLSTLPWRKANPFTQLAGLPGLGASRLLLAAVFTLNLAFAGLQTNFPLFSQARFAWSSVDNGIFFAYVGVCAVLVQGLLYRWVHPRLGERRLAVIGLCLMAVGLAGTALAAQAWMLVPLIGLIALGSGISIPSITGLLSNRVNESAQGRLMGGLQVLLSMTGIFGPALAGAAYEQIGLSAPYALGALLTLAALTITLVAFRRAPRQVEESKRPGKAG
jgi:MFS family permease